MAHIQAHAPPLAGLAKPPPVIFGLQNQRRYLVRLPVQIDSHERDVSAAGVFALAGQNVLREHFYAHFHRGAENSVHAGFQHDNLTDANWEPEIEVVHRCGYNVAIRVAMRRQRAGNVDEMHHAPAQHVT